jgi:hypothetical protein
MKVNKNPSALVVPFGKHKGSTVDELLAKDPSYAEWIMAQGWVAERFAELHAAIQSRGATPDDSPEHNAIQVRFLDVPFMVACLLAAVPQEVKAYVDDHTGEFNRRIHGLMADSNREIMKAEALNPDCPAPFWGYDEDPNRLETWRVYVADRVSAANNAKAEAEAQVAEIKAAYKRPHINPIVKFEQRGIDVVINWRWNDLTIEIKPTMGDDFPSVMRQMERLRTRALVLGEYTGRAVSEPQLRQMFAASGYILVFIRDIEAEIANARAAVSP